MVIFHSYVSLPEGKSWDKPSINWWFGFRNHPPSVPSHPPASGVSGEVPLQPAAQYESRGGHGGGHYVDGHLAADGLRGRGRGAVVDSVGKNHEKPRELVVKYRAFLEICVKV